MVLVKRLATAVALAVLVVVLPGPAFAKTEIVWWHALQATLGERVQEIASKFNASQSEYEVKAMGLRLGNYGSIRDAIEEQMENIFAGKKTAKQGMDDAVAKSNEILKEFAALYK